MTIEEQIIDILEDAFENAQEGTMGGYGPTITDMRTFIKEATPKLLALINAASK